MQNDKENKNEDLFIDIKKIKKLKIMIILNLLKIKNKLQI